MPDDHSDKIWDEYDWERFLQEQELRTEKYMELLEQYMDHPQRDQIIAREMGWTHLLGGESREWEEEVDSDFQPDGAETEQSAGLANPGFFAFEKHPLYRKALAFTTELDEIFEGADQKVQEHPATVTLHSHATLAAAKLAAALNDDDIDELGMSIAYLKRALRALTSALEAVVQLADGGFIDEGRAGLLKTRLFSVRDGTVSAMGDYRAEFRRRHGGR
jgi:hypothetical protein